MDTTTKIIIKLVLSAFLGGLIGLEREMHARAAGLRTHILVATGSTLIMMVSNYIFFIFQEHTADSVLRLDPGRIAAMTMSGIGFLGAGTIIQSKEIVRGLTTAACLWVIAAVGLAVGCGFFLPAIITCIITLVALYLLHYLESFLKRNWYRTVRLISGDDQNFPAIEQVLTAHHMHILRVSMDKHLAQQEVIYDIDIRMKRDIRDFAVVHELSAIAGLKRVQWI